MVAERSITKCILQTINLSVIIKKRNEQIESITQFQ
jgi:hypothetical protein